MMTSPLVVLCALCLLVAGVHSRTTVLTDETGDFESNSAGFNLFKIRAKKGYKVVLEVTKMKLNYESNIKMRDGEWGDITQYKMIGALIEKTDASRQRDYVSLPTRFETVDTRKLIITHNAVNPRPGDGFRAHYTSYTEEGFCQKNVLEHVLINNVVSKTCDTDYLSPVASHCDVTLDCGGNYQQYSRRMTCENGEWEGSIGCYPRSDLMEQCVYDMDRVTSSDGCPFTVDETISYYLEVEGIDVIDEEDSGLAGRAPGGPSCRQSCARRYGRYVKASCGRRGTRSWVKCMICRFKHRCQYQVSFDG